MSTIWVSGLKFRCGQKHPYPLSHLACRCALYNLLVIYSQLPCTHLTKAWKRVVWGWLCFRRPWSKRQNKGHSLLTTILKPHDLSVYSCGIEIPRTILRVSFISRPLLLLRLLLTYIKHLLNKWERSNYLTCGVLDAIPFCGMIVHPEWKWFPVCFPLCDLGRVLLLMDRNLFIHITRIRPFRFAKRISWGNVCYLSSRGRALHQRERWGWRQWCTS